MSFPSYLHIFSEGQYAFSWEMCMEYIKQCCVICETVVGCYATLFSVVICILAWSEFSLFYVFN